MQHLKPSFRASLNRCSIVEARTSLKFMIGFAFNAAPITLIDLLEPVNTFSSSQNRGFVQFANRLLRILANAYAILSTFRREQRRHLLKYAFIAPSAKRYAGMLRPKTHFHLQLIFLKSVEFILVLILYIPQ